MNGLEAGGDKALHERIGAGELAEMLRGRGFRAELGTEQGGRPVLHSASSGVPFHVRFGNAAADGRLEGALYNEGDPGFAVQAFIPRGDPVEGAVQVEPGAVISTRPLDQDNQFLGRVVLAAPRVENRGIIETPDGQSVLVAARNFTMIANDATTIA
ncbi:MAG TPA: hypothetical protein VES39_12450, partial [Rhodospirillales bacterium]|nr:hypothetical protein [Rhodospirillales bacterium]